MRELQAGKAHLGQYWCHDVELRPTNRTRTLRFLRFPPPWVQPWLADRGGGHGARREQAAERSMDSCPVPALREFSIKLDQEG
jgi:hypothetical protein